MFARNVARPVAAFLASSLVLALAACGGGGGGGEASAAVDPASAPALAAQQFTGTVVLPRALQATSAKAMALPGDGRHATKDVSCPAVPDGYDPAAGAAVELIDATGAVLGTSVTDGCGRFDVAATTAVKTVRVLPAGFQPVTVDSGQVGTDFVASALPAGASLEIAALQRSGTRSLSALIVDSASKKAVIGLSAGSVTVLQGGTSNPVQSLDTTGSVLNGAPFSTVLVMDSSSSMQECAANCSGNPTYDRSLPSYNGYQLVARAAHVFLDGKKPTDEVAISAFSSRVHWFDDARFAGAFRRAASTGASYVYSADGFTQSAASLRLPVDYYNRKSQLWVSGGDALHAETVKLGLLPTGDYPLWGTTALFTAVHDAVGRIAPRPVTRRIVIALTDGENNTGSRNLNDAVAAAVASGVPVYTIGFGIDPSASASTKAATDLRELATRTGATATFVNGPDVVGLFAGLQTAIRFESLITLTHDLTPTLPVSLVVSAPGQPTVSREIPAVGAPAG